MDAGHYASDEKKNSVCSFLFLYHLHFLSHQTAFCVEPCFAFIGHCMSLWSSSNIMMIEHLFTQGGLLISFQRKTIETYRHKAKQGSTQRLCNKRENEDDLKRKPHRYVVLLRSKENYQTHFFLEKAKEPTKGRNDLWPLKLHCCIHLVYSYRHCLCVSRFSIMVYKNYSIANKTDKLATISARVRVNNRKR